MLLLWDCFAVTKPLSQIQKSTLWPLQDANPTPSLGGFGLNGTDNGTNGEGKSWKWNKQGGTNDYVTAKILTADATNLAGSLYIQYVPTA